MNLWLAAASAVTAALVPCAFAALRGRAERRLVGLQMAGILVTLALVLFTVGFDRLPFIDLALTLAILSFGSGLVFARFLEKHL
jgi:multisubunit Na+/H+ antiporter MnhF subunit